MLALILVAILAVAAAILNISSRADVNRLDDENRSIRRRLADAESGYNRLLERMRYQENKGLDPRIPRIEAAVSAHSGRLSGLDINERVLSDRLNYTRNVVKALLAHLGLTFDEPKVEVSSTPLTVRKLTPAEKRAQKDC